jgi:hypothetical protein
LRENLLKCFDCFWAFERFDSHITKSPTTLLFNFTFL